MEAKENLLKPALLPSNFLARINKLASDNCSSDVCMFCTGAKPTRNSWLYCKDDHCSNGSNVPDYFLHCDMTHVHQKNLTLLVSSCTTFNEAKVFVEFGFCMYSYVAKTTYLSLPVNVTELNDFMCGELFNRSGTLCGECKDDHYPLVYSFDMQCIKCPRGRSNWWKFVLAAFLPLTMFYLLILCCKLNVTSSHFYGIVWYSQMVCAPVLGRSYILMLRHRPRFLTGSRVVGGDWSY